MENITEILNTTFTNTSFNTTLTNTTLESDNSIFNCEDLTNNGLYMIFIGYLFPLLSPTMRSYLKDKAVQFKNFGKVSGQIVSLSEYGFQRIQKINNNTEMVKFIERLCRDKKVMAIPNEIIECAWSFSGDKDDNHKTMEQSWNKLLKEIEKLDKGINSKRP
tara:strand:+ start:3365 stop:3850 length:486 start_codon:yes stop_codon:yes gene_type:complete